MPRLRAAQSRTPGQFLFRPTQCRAAIHTCRHGMPGKSQLRRAEFRPATSQLALEALHNRAVHLADAAFRKVERSADLLHRQLFVVVEDDDQSLVAIEALRD